MAAASSSLSQFPSSYSSTASRLNHRPGAPASRITFLRRRRQLRVSASFASTVERPSARAHHIGTSGSLYEVLGIQAGATCQEIKAAYRRLVRVLHPDAAPASGEFSGREFMRLHEEYSTLSDPHKRADYERTLLARRRRVVVCTSAAASRGSSVNSGFQGYTMRRKWETDQCW